MPIGTIKNLELGRGFGFIIPGEPGDDVFFHMRALQSLDWDETLIQRRVAYDETTDPRSGRLRAINVRPAK